MGEAPSARLDAVLDHVGVAVPDLAAAQRRWVDQLGAGRLGRVQTDMFATQQLRFAGGGKLELLAPAPDAEPDNFLRRFLIRFGAGVHHLTLIVSDLPAATATVKRAGFDVADVADDDPTWQEFFLRPGQVGGTVVQVAATSRTPAEWLAHFGGNPQEPAAWAPALLGPRLRHPDLAAARKLWSLLGASLDDTAEAPVCSWPGSALTVTLTRGHPAGPVALRLATDAALPADPELGPAVEPEPPVAARTDE